MDTKTKQIKSLDSVKKFSPEANKVVFINKPTMYHVLEDGGGIEVDFKTYFDPDDKLIFLEKGQYIKFLTDKFVIRQIVFEDEELFHNPETRILFKHLVSLGYINFSECADCQRYLNDTVFTNSSSDIIDVSSKQWYWQNPFQASKDEYHVIFDVKQIIDSQYRNHLTNADLSDMMRDYGLNAQALFKDRVGITIKSLMGGKRLVEVKKDVAFTNKSIKEVAYDFGYKDPSYFVRSFKSATGMTPADFRKRTDFEIQENFSEELFDLLENFHTDHRKVDFYAEKMNMSIKTLSKKVKEEFQISIGQLIRRQIVRTAKSHLTDTVSITEVSRMLGFDEANHFTTFFKHYTNMTPSEFLSKKYHG